MLYEESNQFSIIVFLLNPLDKRINLGHGHQHAGPGGAPHAQ